MTSYEDLSPEAKHLLRKARGADHAAREEVTGSIQRFERSSVGRTVRVHQTPRRIARGPAQRSTPWAVLVAILSGALGAYATVGQSVGLPVPRWWSDLSFDSFRDDATAAPEAGPGPQVGGRSTQHRDGTHSPVAEQGETLREVPMPAVTSSIPPEVATAATGHVEQLGALPHSEASAKLATSPNGRAISSPRAALGAVPLGAAPPGPSASGSGDSPLAREIETIGTARDALQSGDYALALRQLESHRVAFPNGALAAERQALAAICQCRTGAGTAAAIAFVSGGITGPLKRRVAKECELDVR